MTGSVIAVVGATGNIGSRLTRLLLARGHTVRALSRGGEHLEQLAEKGAEPHVGSFDEGHGDLEKFLAGADAVFTMVKSNWARYEDHYPTVAARLASALDGSGVKRVVNLSSIGADLVEPHGHHFDFRLLEDALDAVDVPEVLHLRAGYFMENFLSWIPAVVHHRHVVTPFAPDLVIPCVATADIASAAAEALTRAPGEGRFAFEIGSCDVTFSEVAAAIGRSLGREVPYSSVDITAPELEAEFAAQFGLGARWEFDRRTQVAFDHGWARFSSDRQPRATSLDDFVVDVWLPAFEREAAVRVPDVDGAAAWIPEDFTTWLSGRNPPLR